MEIELNKSFNSIELIMNYYLLDKYNKKDKDF